MNSPTSKKPVTERNAYSKQQWAEIQDAFLAIADLRADEREEALAQLAKSNPNIHSEVASLLEHDNASFDSNPVSRSDPNTAKLHELSPIRTPGYQLGKYRLLVPLAINSTSEIWKAESSAPQEATDNNTTVAIKFLRQTPNSDPDLQNRQALRFAQEAHFLSRFQHRGIADFIECGQDEDSSPYIVMQFIPGRPIVEFADLNQLGIDQRLHLMIDVADASSYAHQLMIVHRDLKPDNVLVDDQRSPVILDFGISKQLIGEDDAASGQTDLNLTTTQFRPMTPAYASPEQARGDQVSAATDVHALGLILYELVSGHHPFSNAAHPNTQHFQDRITSSVPIPPSRIASQATTDLHLSTLPADNNSTTKSFVATNPQLIAANRGGLSVKQLQRKLNGDIDAIVMKAIAKEPGERYRNAVDFRNDLLRVVGSPLLSISDGDDQVRSFVRRKPICSLAIATLFSLLIGGGIGWWLATPSDQVASKTTSTDGALDVQPKLNGLSEPVTAASQKVAFEKRLLDVQRLSDQGRPTKAIEALGEFNALLGEDFQLADSFAQRTTEQQDVLLRLLLNVGMTDRANQLAEARYQTDPSIVESAGTRLLQAETRASIGWFEGARELIEPLQADPVRFRASSNDLLLAKFLMLDQVGRKEDLTDQAYQETRAALAGLAATELDSPVAIRVSGAASLRAAALDVEFENHAEAESLLQKMVSRFKAANQPDHHLAVLGRLRLAKIFESQNDSSSHKFWFQQCRDSLQRSNEYGTPTAIEFVLDRMRGVDQSGEKVATIIESTKPWSAVYKSNPYQYRWFLRYQSEAAIAAQDWDMALANSTPLIEIEQELWGDEALDTLYAVAISSFANSKLAVNNSGENKNTLMKTRATTQAHLAKHVEKEANNLASAFLAAACNTERPLPNFDEYQWIHHFLMQRTNDLDVQFEMVAYHLEQASNDCLPATVNLIQSLSTRDDIFADSEDNASRLIRVLNVVGLVKEHLGERCCDSLRTKLSSLKSSQFSDLAAAANRTIRLLEKQ